MKRLSPSHETILHDPAFFVGEQRAVLHRDLAFQRLEPLLHDLGSDSRVHVVHGHLVEAAVEESSFHSGGRRAGQRTLAGGDLHDPQCGLISGCDNCKVQRMLSRPRYQSFGTISPLQAEGRLDDLLCADLAKRKEKPCGGTRKYEAEGRSNGDAVHPARFTRFRPHRKPRSQRRGGFALVEATLALSLLTVVGLILLKLSLNVVYPRQYALQQVLSDAYMTFERARSERIPFENLVATNSPWPAYPAVSTETVEIGKLPGGKAVTGQVTRTRIADGDNYPIDGGTGNVASNPAAMKIWRVQSVLRYTISQRTYVKSRTLVRAQ